MKEGNIVVKTLDGKIVVDCSVWFLLLNLVNHSFNDSFTLKISECEVFIDDEQIRQISLEDEENETL